MAQLLKLTIAVMLNTIYVFNLNTTNATILEELDYTRLEVLGASCSPNDTCHSTVRLPDEKMTCRCDALCELYNDCCIDATRFAPRRTHQMTEQRLSCLTYESAINGIYTVSKCNNNYRGSQEVRANCELFEDISDPLVAAPATDVVLNITYKNRYCAECNNASPQNIRSWAISIQCNDIPDNTSIPLVDSAYVKEHLTYVRSGQSRNNWGFYYTSQNMPEAGTEFYPCRIPYILPKALEKHVRKCRPNVISSCAPSWRRNMHRDLCSAYMALVYVDNQIYRNPDCAYCNMKNLEDLECNIPELVITGRRKKPALSFTHLLDVTMDDGNIVGEIEDTRCPEHQMWDPMSNKCRRIVCAIPGYKKRGDRCVKPS